MSLWLSTFNWLMRLGGSVVDIYNNKIEKLPVERQ